MARCTLKVQGLDCPGEVPPLRSALEGAPGVLGMVFDPPGGTVSVDYDPEATAPEALAERIESRAGMRAEPLSQELGFSIDGWWSRWRRGLTTGASGLALAVGLGLHWWDGPKVAVGLAYALAIGFGGIELVPKAIQSARRRRLGIHLLMTLAILGALALGQWEEAAAVAFLFGLAEALEALSLSKAQRAVRALLEVAPETAELMVSEGGTQTVAASAVVPGQRVLVRAGDRVPVDGRIASGRSSLDQKTLTGESVPVSKGPGDEVFAGTINGDGTLEIEASRPLSEAVVTRTIELVRQAQVRRSPLERTVERFAVVYTPIVVGLSVALMVLPPLVLGLWGMTTGPEVWREWFHRGLVVLVIACPCALVIGTPVAVVCGLATAARRGVLVKGGQFLEACGRLRSLAFDKTGTLTQGVPDVVEVVPSNGAEGDRMLQIAAALGDRGSHVLGRAIARHARGLRLDIPPAHDYQAVPGLGASGRVDATEYHIGSHKFIDKLGHCEATFHDAIDQAASGAGTAIALTAKSGPLGWIRLADRPRSEAAEILAELHRLGLRTVMLTGDHATTAEAMAREIGVGAHRSELLPAEKAEAVAELDRHQGPIGMVGDGVNDAPALASARVGIALGGVSSGAALEAADIVLMADDLRPLPWLIRHSRRTMRMVRQNIALAIGAKLVVLALAVVGLATLWLAILADVGMTLVVVANALRLLRADS